MRYHWHENLTLQ